MALNNILNFLKTKFNTDGLIFLGFLKYQNVIMKCFECRFFSFLYFFSYLVSKHIEPFYLSKLLVKNIDIDLIRWISNQNTISVLFLQLNLTQETSFTNLNSVDFTKTFFMCQDRTIVNAIISSYLNTFYWYFFIFAFAFEDFE